MAVASAVVAAVTSSTRRAAARRGHVRTLNTSSDQQHLGGSIRALMRSSAQPVAIITTVLPSERHAHGATLSSFTTVSLEPPLVAFSLKTPSRLADALSHHTTASPSQAHFVINVLSHDQADAAQAFAKPGLTPFPLSDAWLSARSDALVNDQDRTRTPSPPSASHPLTLAKSRASRFAKSAEGVRVPVLSESVGALACSLVRRIGLTEQSLTSEQKSLDQQDGTSDLFLARIHAVEDVDDGKERLPLVYWERSFTSVAR